MNKMLRTGLMFAAAATLSSVVLAAPMFKFGKDEGKNMMMGSKDEITIAPYSKMTLLARNVSAKEAVLIYQGKDAHAPFEFYEKALVKDGWKLAGDAMGAMDKPADAMAKPADTMAKPGDAMAKPGDAMAKPGDAMAKPGDAMAKPADAMAKGDDAMMMKKSYDAKFTMKTFSITLTSKLTGTDRVTVEFKLK